MKITTITPYWNRPDVLPIWLKAIAGSTIPNVEHILFFVGEKAPAIPNAPPRLRVAEISKSDPFSIGHCHNVGARLANTEWIMKIDIDTFPCLMFFRKLIGILESAGPREWFNCGMLYFKQEHSRSLLTTEKMPVSSVLHLLICQNMKLYSAHGYSLPSATNFICRTQDYLNLGGCDKRFDGYGWEDYQQIYMLEKHQQGKDPLPGPVTFENVTWRCREEISRRKAKKLFLRDSSFCLLHHWHPPVVKDRDRLNRNRQILLEYIEKNRNKA